MQSLETQIEQLSANPPKTFTDSEAQAIQNVIQGLDSGSLRVAESLHGEWKVNAWVKKAILLYFRLQNSSLIESGDINFFDKVPPKKWTGQEGVRVVPTAIVRYGSYVESGAILMPSFVNIGARVGTGTMVDTWATVGSCAQIGKHVHLSGGVGIGGVLEPAQAAPVIVEDNVFVGSRSILVEGAFISQAAVIGAGVTITGSTKIIDVNTGKTYSGFVPPRSVVIPGTYQREYAAGTYGVPCALIIGERKASTDMKTSLNEALRDYQIS